MFNQFNSSREDCTEDCTVEKAVQTDQLKKIRFAVATHFLQLVSQYATQPQYLSANVQMDDRYDISTVHLSNSQTAFKQEVNIARNILATSGGFFTIRVMFFDSGN